MGLKQTSKSQSSPLRRESFRRGGGFFQAVAILEIGCDAHAQTVISDLGSDASRRHAALDHRVGVRLGEGVVSRPVPRR